MLSQFDLYLYLTCKHWFFYENFVRTCWFAQIWLVDNVAQQVADEDVQAGARDEPGVPGKPSQVIHNDCCWFMIIMILIDDCGVVSWWSSWIMVLNEIFSERTNMSNTLNTWIHQNIRILPFFQFGNIQALNYKGKFAMFHTEMTPSPFSKKSSIFGIQG